MARQDRITREAAPLRQQVVKYLREDILSSELTPGERLRESALCTRYGVSRTVIREALRQHFATALPWTEWHHKQPSVTVLPLGEEFPANSGAEQGDAFGSAQSALALDAARDVRGVELADQPQRHVDARRDAGGGHEVRVPGGGVIVHLCLF